MPAAPQGMSSVYFNKGENCIAAGRLFVEESIHDEFISRVVSEPKHWHCPTAEQFIDIDNKQHSKQS